MSIQLPLAYTDPRGVVWHPYSVEFDTADGTFSAYIYAVDDAHAEFQLGCLRATARLAGVVLGAQPVDEAEVNAHRASPRRPS